VLCSLSQGCICSEGCDSIVGFINTAGGKAQRAFLEGLASIQGLPRAVMLGASAALAEDTRTGEAAIDGVPQVDSYAVELDINEGNLIATAFMSGTLFSIGYYWTVRRLVVQTRARFVKGLATTLENLTKSILDGVRRPDGLGYERQGINQLVGQIDDMKKLAAQGKVDEYMIAALTVKREIKDIKELTERFEDTMRTLQYANTIGDNLTNIDPTTGRLIGHPKSVLTPKQVAQLQTIADSNQFFGREFGTTGSRFERVGQRKLRPFADKDLAIAANMFLPNPNAIDDVANISVVLDNYRTGMASLIDDLDNIESLLDGFTSKINPMNISQFTDEATKSKMLLTQDAVQGFANGTKNVILNVDDVAATLKTTTDDVIKMTDGFFTRQFTRLTQGTTYAALRVSGVPKATSSGIATKVGKGATLFGRVLGTILVVDTAIWVATGLFDLAFVDEDTDTGYLAENWGFSPIGYLVEEAFNFFIPESAQEALLQSFQAMLVAALNSETFGGMVQTVVGWYINEINITVVPVAFYEPQTIELGFPLGGIAKADPLAILEVALYATVAKIIFTQWVQPAFNYFVKQTPA